MPTRLKLSVMPFSALLLTGLVAGVAYPQAAPPLKPEAQEAPLLVDRPVAELIKEIPELQHLEPAADQRDLSALLAGVGKYVESMYQQFSNTTSTERVRQETLQKKGKVGSWKETEFEYLCLAHRESKFVSLDEHRTHAREIHPPSTKGENFMLTSGFVSTCLHFHPENQSESTIRYLGLQRMDGHDTVVLAFAQRPDATGLTCRFKAGTVSAEVRTQGLVWIDSSTYQIIRMRTDLLQPAPRLRLARVTTNIGFTQVRFSELSAEVWLPREVVVNLEWAGRNYRNLHQYSDFRLFTVKTKVSK